MTSELNSPNFDDRTPIPIAEESSSEILKPKKDDSPNPQRGFVGLSWIVIIGITAALFFLTTYSQLFSEPTETSRAELLQITLIGKVSVAQKYLSRTVAAEPSESDEEDPASEDADSEKAAGQPDRQSKKKSDRKASETSHVDQQILTQLRPHDTGSLEQRYCYALLVNEVAGPDDALAALEKTDQLVEELDYQPTESQQRLRAVIGAMLDRYVAGDLDSNRLPRADRELLEEQLDWIGQLALYPPGTPHRDQRKDLVSSATRSMWVMLGGCFFLVMLILAGLACGLVFVFLAANGNLQSALVSRSERGAIYAETFALWMLGFVALQLLLSVLSVELRLGTQQRLLITVVVFFGSLTVLIWPILRGASFSEVRRDIGLQWANPIVESVTGAVSYVAIIPFLLVAVAAVFALLVLMSAFSEPNPLAPQGTPGHPIQEEIASGNPTTWLLVFVTACIAAPIVEETMFRGVLYRHLRELTARSTRWLSIASAALISSFVFALIHPQGLLGVPLLATLAVGFSLVREWRGSLIAPMVMHAINNGMVTCFLFLVFS